jgi:hypothetical protein
MDTVEYIKVLPLPGIEPRLLSFEPADMQTELCAVSKYKQTKILLLNITCYLHISVG